MTNQSFFDFINAQAYETLKPLWNEYISETGNGEPIYDGIEELARMVFFGELENWGDNGYGNLESCWSVDSSPISTLSLTEWLANSNHEFYQEWKEEQENEE